MEISLQQEEPQNYFSEKSGISCVETGLWKTHIILNMKALVKL